MVDLGRADHGTSTAERSAAARAALEQSRLRTGQADHDGACELLAGALVRLGGSDAELELLLRAQLAAALTFAGRPRRKVWASTRPSAADAVAGSPDAPALGRRAMLAARVCEMALAGTPSWQTLTLARRVMRTSPHADPATDGSLSLLLALGAVQRLDLAQTCARRALRSAHRTGSRSMIVALRSLAPYGPLLRGEAVAAETESRIALVVARDSGLALWETFALACLVAALLDQGRVEDAGRELALALPDGRIPGDLAGCLLRHSRARLLAARGDDEAALSESLECGRRLLAAGASTPSIHWRSQAGLIEHRLGHATASRRLIDTEVSLAQRLGVCGPLGVALRAQGLVRTGGEQIELLSRSAEMLGRSPARLEPRPLPVRARRRAAPRRRWRPRPHPARAIA